MADYEQSKSQKKSKCISITLIVVGVIMVAVGVALIYVLKDVATDQINEQMPLKNGTEIFKAWVNPPSPVYMQFWFFDVVNAENYTKGGVKPIVRERGPYTYRELRPKTRLHFLDDGDLISYVQPKSYVFMRNMSVGDENDTFIGINFPVLSVATMVRFMNGALQWGLKELLSVSGEKLFRNYTVKGFLWGYKEPLVQKINKLAEPFLHRKLIPNDTFGIFYGPTGNGTYDGEYTVYTGKKDLRKYIEVEKWNNKSSVNFWNTKYCNMINGTDGSGWHPFVTKDDTLYIYSSDVCRSLYVTYVKDVSVKGIEMYKFSTPNSVLADNATNPANAGYCKPDCLGSGVLNVSICREGSPSIISQPHFYQGDQEYIDAIDGIKPDPEQHATIIDVEPTTGAVLNAAKKLQMNFYIRPLKGLADTEKLNETIFPILWLNESAMISDDEAAQFKKRVLMPIEVSHILPWVLLAVGAFLFVIGCIVLVLWGVSSNADTVGIRPDDEEGEDDVSHGLLNSSDPHTSYNSTA